jgi:effector-binding domain-containing protein
MAYEVQVKELPSLLALTVHGRASMATIGAEIGKAFATLFASMAATGAQPAGPPFGLYPAEVTAEYDFTLCIPVAAEATATGGVGLEEIPGGAVASTLHRGSYATLGDAYGAVQAWMVAHGKKPVGPCREIYLTGPDVPPEELLTEIDWPFV